MSTFIITKQMTEFYKIENANYICGEGKNIFQFIYIPNLNFIEINEKTVVVGDLNAYSKIWY